MARSEGEREPRAKECRASDTGAVQCIAPYSSGEPGSSRHNINGISHLCNCKETLLGLTRHENVRKGNSFGGTLSHQLAAGQCRTLIKGTPINRAASSRERELPRAEHGLH